MEPTIGEKKLYGSNIEVLERNGNCTVYRMNCRDGSGTMTSFQVFPGIELIYNDFAACGCFQATEAREDIMEINHCRKGRFECEFPQGCYIYIGEGDMAVNLLSNPATGASFPLGIYQGITVILRTREAEAALAQLPADMRFDPAALARRLRLPEQCFILRAREEIEHIWGELYTVNPLIQKGYLKLKILELFLFLGMIDFAGEHGGRRYFPKKQVETVKHIRSHLTENLEEHYTLSQLAREHDIGLTTLKICFREIYGKPIFSYMKEYRMNAAAVMLRDGSDSVGAIAGKVGYENASKFAGAFKEVMGVSPRQYRKTARPFGAGTVRPE